METEIVINQSLNEKDVAKASTKILLSGRITIYLAILFIIVTINIFNTNILLNEDEQDVFTFLPCLLPFVVGVLFYYLTIYAAKKTYRNNQRYYQDTVFTFNEESLKIVGKDFENSVPWTNYKRIKETQDWFLIYVNHNQAQIIDKTVLNGQQIQNLKDLFRTLVPKIKVSIK
jgi:hypothetical protein